MPSPTDHPALTTSQDVTPEAYDWLQQQADDATAQAKSVRVLNWIVQSVCDPQSLVN
jgi:hypothetical protein